MKPRSLSANAAWPSLSCRAWFGKILFYPLSLLPVTQTLKDAMNQTFLILAVVFLAALPVPAGADTRCYQFTDPSLPPQAALLSPTRTSCATTPTGACWYRVTSWRTDPPPYYLWLAAPSSWDF